MASISAASRETGQILVRPAKFNDVPKMAFTAFTGYAGSPLEQFLSPLREEYPEDALRSWKHRLALRWFDPRMICVVACPASSPEKVVGYAQFFRLGDDRGAKQQIASRKTIWLSTLAWYYSIKFKIMDYIWPDRSVNPAAEKQFGAWCRIDDEKHWNLHPKRKNRWHLRSIVVSPESRGKGVGTLLMKPLLDRAQKEGVIVGLEASADGEHLYRKMGFELLSRFYYEEGNPIASPNAGGVMMWTPDKVKGS
jgi:ribosomal protein S18 acetylase RimI-like enzyme